jgi:hypothetical protein
MISVATKDPLIFFTWRLFCLSIGGGSFSRTKLEQFKLKHAKLFECLAANIMKLTERFIPMFTLENLYAVSKTWTSKKMAGKDGKVDLQLGLVGNLTLYMFYIGILSIRPDLFAIPTPKLKEFLTYLKIKVFFSKSFKCTMKACDKPNSWTTCKECLYVHVRTRTRKAEQRLLKDFEAYHLKDTIRHVKSAMADELKEKKIPMAMEVWELFKDIPVDYPPPTASAAAAAAAQPTNGTTKKIPTKRTKRDVAAAPEPDAPEVPTFDHDQYKQKLIQTAFFEMLRQLKIIVQNLD